MKFTNQKNISIDKVAVHNFTCSSVYDKVIECIRLLKCCITYYYGVNVGFCNNDTSRFIVYMSYNKSFSFSFVLNETETKMYIITMKYLEKKQFKWSYMIKMDHILVGIVDLD